jgi:hypothetical protein
MTSILAISDLASRPQLQNAHRWFSRSDPTIMITVVTVIGLICLGMLIAAMWQRIREWRMEPARRQPMALFRRLQRQLGLRWMDRWRLWRLARRLQLPHPSALLISELYFDQCVEKAAKMGGGTIDTYLSLRKHLFQI